MGHSWSFLENHVAWGIEPGPLHLKQVLQSILQVWDSVLQAWEVEPQKLYFDFTSYYLQKKLNLFGILFPQLQR